MAYGGDGNLQDYPDECDIDVRGATFTLEEEKEEKYHSRKMLRVIERDLDRKMKLDLYENETSDIASNVDVDEYYDTKDKRGILVLLNNKVHREGHEMDTKRLKRFFKGTLNFDIMDAYDDTEFTFKKTDIDTFLQHVESALWKNRNKYYCIVFFIGSHGNEDGFSTNDERVYTVEDIKQKFKNDRCLAMAGRPKIILAQVCRGIKYEKTVCRADSGLIRATNNCATEDSDSLVFNATTYVVKLTAASFV